MIGIVKSIYSEVVKASELLRDNGSIDLKNEYEDSFALSYNRYVGVTYSNPWEMPQLPHPKQNEKRNKVLRDRALEISKRRDVWIKFPDPPDDFEFNIHYAMPFAVQALKTDQELQIARQIFVPGRMSVYNFWRKYFWYIELMKCTVIDEFQLVSVEPAIEPESNTTSFDENGGNTIQYSSIPKFYKQARIAVIREHMRKKLCAANAASISISQTEQHERRRKVSFSDLPNIIPEAEAGASSIIADS